LEFLALVDRLTMMPMLALYTPSRARSFPRLNLKQQDIVASLKRYPLHVRQSSHTQVCNFVSFNYANARRLDAPKVASLKHL
jgi:hypothetical protein